MSLQANIKELYGHTSPSVQRFANQAAELQQLLETKQISKSEFDELVRDLERSKAINEAAGDLALKSAIHETIMGLKNLAGAIF